MIHWYSLPRALSRHGTSLCSPPPITLDTCHVRLLVVISKQQVYSRQECIPVGCVPSAAVTISGREGVCPGECLPGEGVSAQGRGVCRGGVCPGGVSVQGGCLSVCRGVCHTHTREQNHRRL